MQAISAPTKQQNTIPEKNEKEMNGNRLTVVVDEAGADGDGAPQHERAGEDLVGPKALDGHDPGDLEEDVEDEEEGVDVAELV